MAGQMYGGGPYMHPPNMGHHHPHHQMIHHNINNPVSARCAAVAGCGSGGSGGCSWVSGGCGCGSGGGCVSGRSAVRTW